MKKWTHLTITVTAVAAALAIGLTSASASPPAPPTGGAAVPADVRPLAPAIASDPQTKPESVLIPITPCRIVDTRQAGGPVHNGNTLAYYVGGTAGFTGQGGKAGGCGIPVGATAVAAVITAVNPSHLGYMKAYPTGQPAPNSSVLNYPANLTIGSGVTLPIQSTSAQSLRVFNFGGPTQLTIDVQGYYAPQIQGLIGSDGSIASGTTRIVSASHAGTGFYYVTLDRPARQCSPVVNTFNLYHYASVGLSSSSTPNTISVFVWTLNATTHVETPADYPFFLTVTC